MKKTILTAIALVTLAGSSASAVTIPSRINDKPKTTPTQPGPDTSASPPGCRLNDPNGCGIYDGL